MFEKEAEEIAKDIYIHHFDDDVNYPCVLQAITVGVQQGAEFGYNKANEWYFVKDGLPKVSGRYFVYVGGGEKGVYPLDFETEYNDFGYWCLEVASASLGVTDTVFETITERNEDKVIAWKEIVLPKEIE